MAINEGSVTPVDYDIEGKVEEAAATATSTVGEDGVLGFINGRDGSTFVGINDNNKAAFQEALKAYINGVNGILEQITAPDIEQGLKGPAADAYKKFILAMKSVLSQYVEALNEEYTVLETTFANLTARADAIASDSESDANALNGITIA